MKKSTYLKTFGFTNLVYQYFKEGLTHLGLRRQKIHGKQMELLGDLVYPPNPKLWSLVLMGIRMLKMGQELVKHLCQN